MEFCQVQNSLFIQVLHSPILAALLHGTRAVGMIQTLRHGDMMWQEISHICGLACSCRRAS